MPTVPVKAAGWRIEPPVSVAVAAAHSQAETAVAEPPDEPPGTSRWLSSVRSVLAPPAMTKPPSPICVAGMTLVVDARAPPRIDDRAVIGRLVGRAHGELVHVELAEHDGAVGPQIGRDGRFVARLEAVEHVAAGLGMDAFGGEQILDAERDAFERTALASRQPLVRRLGHRARLVRGDGDIGIELRDWRARSPRGSFRSARPT